MKLSQMKLRAMPHTECALTGEDTLRVYKTGAQEPDINTYVALADTDFHNGVIEVDVCGKLLSEAPAYARGFIGIVFRAAEDGREFEGFYIRPANGPHCPDPERRAHGCQYFSFPGYTFAYFREFGIPEYEAPVDTIELGKWSRIRAEVREDSAAFSVDGRPVLKVRGLKHGAAARGNVGLYVDNGTDALFRNLQIQRED